jgi:hypothetical protein
MKAIPWYEERNGIGGIVRKEEAKFGTALAMATGPEPEYKCNSGWQFLSWPI